MKYFIYCDESGEASFSTKSSYDYFSICALTVEENKKNKIKSTMKRKKAKLYKLGWPKEVEIKASVLYSLRRNKKIPQKVKNNIRGDSFIQEVLISLKNSCSPKIDYIIVRKDGLQDASFRSSPYGIAYNFFAGKILIPIILKYKDCFLTIDRRNKEMHPHKHFDGYIETTARGEAFEKGINLSLEIRHEESSINSGLQAVDFFSWSIYRKVRNGDTRFFNIFKDLIMQNYEWYCR